MAATERTPLLGASSERVAQQSGHQAAPTTPNDGAQTPEEIAAAEEAALELAKENLPKSVLYVSLLSIMTALFLAALDGTLVVTLLAPISSSFGAAELLPWLGASYMLSTCACSPLYGKLSDVIGRKRAILTALGFFALGTALCAVAPNMQALIGARAVAGMGGGGLLTCASVIMGDLLPLRKRGLYQGITQIIFSIGSALGGPTGGILCERFGWRWSFVFQIPLLAGAFLIILTFLALPAHAPPKPVSDSTDADVQRSSSARFLTLLGRLDLPGSALLVFSLLGLLFGIQSGSALDDWHTWAYLAAFVVLGVLFVVNEALVKEPVLPLRLLTQRTTICGAAYYFLSSTAFTGFFFHFPLFFQAVLLQSPSQTGLKFIPLSIAISISSVGVGFLMRVTGKYWKMLLVLVSFSVVSTVFIATWDENTTSPVAHFMAPLPMGIGGGSFTIMIVAMIGSVSRADQAAINGLIYLVRGLGQVIGVGTLGALFQYTLARELAARLKGPGAEATIKRVLHDFNYGRTLDSPWREEVIQAFVVSLRAVFIVCSILFVICFLLCLGVKEKPLGGAGPAPPQAPAAAEEAATRHEATTQTPDDTVRT